MDKRERVAAALWRARIEDAGAPQSAINARTPEAFLEGSPDFQVAWLKMADAAIAALEPVTVHPSCRVMATQWEDHTCPECGTDFSVALRALAEKAPE